MKLKQLTRGMQGLEIKGSKEIAITGLCSDSRMAAPGNLFIAKSGTAAYGGDFVEKALAAGAVAVVTDLYNPFLKATQLICREPIQMEGQLAARYYGHPSEKLFVVGVTGTKGKTTTAYLIRHLFEGLGEKCGLIGSVEAIVGARVIPSKLTTHDVITNHKLLREMCDGGCEAAVLEVSSHGLEQGRVGEIAFDIGLFTNLTPDHMDYHKTMDNYAAAKGKLFQGLEGTAIVNGDSPWADKMQGGKKRVTFGLGAVDVRATDVQDGEFWVKGVRFVTQLMGRFNIYNMLGAIAVGLEVGAPLAKIAEIMATFQNVPGRMERVPNRRGIEVFVDHAHMGDALENVLKTVRELNPKRVILVFGCGGDRDPGRRVQMAEVAEKLADLSIVTNDNPRGEDPAKIAEQILGGFLHPEKVVMELDRAKAITKAIQMAEKGDVVLIAGKGHEKTQIFARQTIPFDDVLVAKEALF